MSLDKKKIALSAAQGATRGAAAGGAAAIMTGIGLAQVPVTFMWIPVAATTVVAWPVVVGIGAATAVIAGAGYAYTEYTRQSKIEEEFKKYTEK
jgi:hypothetical protein